MPEQHLDPSAAACTGATNLDQDGLRLLSRSPHPYHRQNFELLDPTDAYTTRSSTYPTPSRDRTPSSDSGTEADDEHFLKGLPAPRRLHKGIRGLNEVVSGSSTPLLSPAALDEDGRNSAYISRKELVPFKQARPSADKLKRRREIIRRLTELLIIVSLGVLVRSNPFVQPVLRRWSLECVVCVGLIFLLALLYPLRLAIWSYVHRKPSRRIPISLPSSFDPAPLLYPPAIALLVSSLIAVDNETTLLLNIVLAICSLPPALIPALSPSDDGCNALHWLLSMAPLVISQTQTEEQVSIPVQAALSPETAALLYPLHCNLLRTLHALTTTSLLTAEVQLLSIALINVLLLSSSPQASILRAMLWVGGFDILISCSQAIKWGIALARVPKWRFKRSPSPSKKTSNFLSNLLAWRRVRHDLFHAPMDSSSCSSCEAIDDPDDSNDDLGIRASRGPLRIKTISFDGAVSDGIGNGRAPDGEGTQDLRHPADEYKVESTPLRRHTLPGSGRLLHKSHTHTPSGRKKRSASSSIRAFFSLTQRQATMRKWVYAVYVYICILATVFVPLPFVGVKEVVQDEALHGFEPVGWALGFLFGDLSWFRWQVVSHNLERWICLPARSGTPREELAFGVVESFRNQFGEGNTRLLLSAYCILVILIGLVVVFRLSPIYEVDTRRKVFHFMMVAMFLPSTFIDPTFAALALSIILAVFLLLDLLRASQLPPLSKPLASFLAPYVDGRDLRGPVVISHIFLLIGCAIPLWLSLGSLPRTGAGFLRGWEVPTREVSMVSGVVCVGLGDAAASLIGRRYGHRKWLWGGGKSLEGSVAFSVAVFAGLMVTHIWLWVGGWPATNGHEDTLAMTAQKAGICASMASVTEAVLTGGNDNVIVPVVLWTCVKSLGV
ncbi:hypothetical protein F5Y15DRAFT_395610 [Xylariaceae sp. FL0016]|nr:hypothetical protein F5Y15DRAFT_395610 [Xylariaceae sp. FL0016]